MVASLELAEERRGLAPHARSIRACLSGLARRCFEKRADQVLEPTQSSNHHAFAAGGPFFRALQAVILL